MNFWMGKCNLWYTTSHISYLFQIQNATWQNHFVFIILCTYLHKNLADCSEMIYGLLCSTYVRTVWLKKKNRVWSKTPLFRLLKRSCKIGNKLARCSLKCSLMKKCTCIFYHLCRIYAPLCIFKCYLARKFNSLDGRTNYGQWMPCPLEAIIVN